MLDAPKKKQLLKIARHSIENYLKTGSPIDVFSDDPDLCKKLGAFVTLRSQGALRGCIGTVSPLSSLFMLVRDLALSAAFEDPRFRPVVKAELSGLDIEISVLSAPEKITDPAQIVMGKHGVMIRKGARSGVYLPQVHSETGWDTSEFMESLCVDKAGLPPDAWISGEVEIFIFTADIFGEKDFT